MKLGSHNDCLEQSKLGVSSKCKPGNGFQDSRNHFRVAVICHVTSLLPGQLNWISCTEPLMMHQQRGQREAKELEMRNRDGKKHEVRRLKRQL